MARQTARSKFLTRPFKLNLAEGPSLLRWNGKRAGGVGVFIALTRQDVRTLPFQFAILSWRAPLSEGRFNGFLIWHKNALPRSATGTSLAGAKRCNKTRGGNFFCLLECKAAKRCFDAHIKLPIHGLAVVGSTLNSLNNMSGEWFTHNWSSVRTAVVLMYFRC
jgi:hypothetical protein